MTSLTVKMDDLSNMSNMIADQLTLSSPEQRDQSYCDVHGIASEIEESPEMIQMSLQEMDRRLSEIKDKTAYDLAEAMEESYVNNETFRLIFLRSENFRANVAAEKIVNHFEVKKELFGSSKLVKDITQSELSDGDISTLYSGFHQQLRAKDCAGRLVWVFYPGTRTSSLKHEEKMRAIFYMLMIAYEEVEVQRKGHIAMIIPDDAHSSNKIAQGWSNSLLQIMNMLSKALPSKTRGIHYLNMLSSPFGKFVSDIFIKGASSILFEPYLLCRMRVHKARTLEECLDLVKTFGVPTSLVATSSGDNKNHIEMMMKLREVEMLQNSQSTPQIEISTTFCIPCNADILLGRGGRIRSHPGNKKFRSIVDDYSDFYDGAGKFERKGVADQIVQVVKGEGRRFLKKEKLGWVEVSDDQARLKVGNVFRAIRKKRLRQLG